MVLLDVFKVLEYVLGKEVGWLTLEGPTRVEGAPTPRGHADHRHGCHACFMTSTPSPLDHVCSKKIAPDGFIPFGLRLIFLFFETLKEAKNNNSGLGLQLIG